MFDPHLRERARMPAFLAYMPPGAAALRTLPAQGCHWPSGEVEDESFAFCGQPCGHGSYCPVHRRLALRKRR